MRVLYDSFFAQTLREQRGVLWSSSSSSSSSSRWEVGAVLRSKETDIGGPYLSPSRYANFDFEETQNPKTNPGIYRAICYQLALGDSLIFNSIRLADKLDPEFLSASDWLRSEGDSLAAAAAAAAAEDGDAAEPDTAAAATAAAARGQPAAELALEGFHSPTQFSPAAFRVRP
ncbi:DNA polymerase, related [Eimeria tenella]|uniref:DNA polymerase, related n=1 Tax=Eimeria tenella TaxID=5802 RepID=U6KN90_EIMTE|nr:DNA polymerase, related [Eimeria tenella]CDJ39572.1 DNA polymerase, related [Eimeria tenella]|eukprot:XP_013230327.1 DNA polymerase, related [Eimeria tenella]